MNEDTLKILLVEDDEAHARAVSRAFRAAGADIRLITASTIREARAHLEDLDPDLVITDLRLTDGKGTDLLSHEDGIPTFPVLVMTAYGSQEIAVEAMKAGALDFVVKSESTFSEMPRIARRAVREWDHMVKRRKAEQDLRRSEARLAEAERIAKIGNWEWDALTNEVYWSAGTYGIFEVTPAEFKPDYEGHLRFIPAEDREDYERTVRECLSSKEPFEYEFRMVTRTGRSKTIWVRGRVKLDDTESPAGMWGTIQDITDRKRAEEELVRLATAIEQSAESVMITDSQGAIVYVNPAFERTSGYSKEEAYGRSARIVKSGEHGPEFYQVMWTALLNGNTWSGHLINRTKNGDIYEEEAVISPVRNKQGEIVNYVAVKRDVTQEALLEKQLREAQKMQAIGTLTGGIAHDFNNLLHIIAGNSELLLMDTPPTGPGYGELKAINMAAARGSDLVKRMLTFGRRVEARLEPMDLNEEIRQVERLLYRTIPKMIETELDLAEDLKLIDGDVSQVEQVLVNLALNARDAMPDGGRLIIETANVHLDEAYCRMNPSARPGSYVLLAVSDTGSGMDGRIVERVFEPFFSTKSPDKGSGLGLSVVFGIVKLHGGHIKCYSEPGIGTTFRIYLPVAEKEKGLEKPLFQETACGGTETLLVADDEELIRELAGKILSGAGYSVVVAADGRECVDLYRQRKSAISLIILDLIMPGMGGKECLEELLRINPLVKVLIASGFSVNGQTRATLEAGAKGYVSKPFNMKELLRSVRRVLDGGRKA
ncbi:MAG: response regulator [Pseudomonadota bacterium]